MSLRYKICSKCGDKKPINKFCKDKQKADGYHPHCFDCRRKYREDNSEYIANRHKDYVKKNKEKLEKCWKEYHAKNRDRCNARTRDWYANNKEYAVIEAIKRNKKYLKNNIDRKLAERLRCRIRNAIKNDSGEKAFSSKELLGCSISVVRKHLENLFLEGMSWENHGEWHIDHIMPCFSFNLKDAEEQKKCFNYKNLQPLWAADNLAKNKFVGKPSV